MSPAPYCRYRLARLDPQLVRALPTIGKVTVRVSGGPVASSPAAAAGGWVEGKAGTRLYLMVQQNTEGRFRKRADETGRYAVHFGFQRTILLCPLCLPSMLCHLSTLSMLCLLRWRWLPGGECAAQPARSACAQPGTRAAPCCVAQHWAAGRGWLCAAGGQGTTLNTWEPRIICVKERLG